MSDAQPLLAGLDEPGQDADDEADHDQAEDLEHSVLLRSTGARGPGTAPGAAHRFMMEPVPVGSAGEAPSPNRDLHVARSRVRGRGPRGRAPCPAPRRRSAAPAGAGRPAAAAGRRRRHRSGSCVMVMLTRVPPPVVSASSIRVVQVSGVSTSRVATSRGGTQSTISPWGAPAAGRTAVEPARRAHERRPDAGRRGFGADDVGDVADGAVGLQDGEGAPHLGPRLRDLADAARAGGAVSHRCGCPRRPRTRPGSRRGAAGRSCAPAAARCCPGRSCGRRAAATRRRSRSRSASSGAAVPTSTTIRACARSAWYSRRRNSYSEPLLKSSSAARG